MSINDALNRTVDRHREWIHHSFYNLWSRFDHLCVRLQMNNCVARLVFAVFLVCFSMLAAAMEANESPVRVRYGTTYGECIGYCSKSIEVFSTRVAFSATAYHPQKKPAPISSSIALSQQEQDELRRLISSTTIDWLPERIDCPDCADDGAEWIEVNRGGRLKRITFEKGKPPIQLKSFIAWLSAMQQRFLVPSLR